MRHELLNTKISALSLIMCSLMFVQQLLAQDSSSKSDTKITLSFLGKDSARQVMASLTRTDGSGNDSAVKGVEIHFYVYRSFGLLPIEAEDLSTDDNGKVAVDFPDDIPGDKSGNVTVIAKVEDNDEIGNLETKETVQWGVPVNTQPTVPTRALWSSANNAPWALVISVTAMVGIVWGIIFYILYQLIALKRAGNFK